MFDIGHVQNATGSTPNHDMGELKDSTLPGANDGCPITKVQMEDIYYSLRAVMKRVNITPDESPEGIITSQFRDALIQNIRSLQTIDANTTFTQFFNDTDVYFTCTADRTCDIQAGSNRAGNELTIYNNASGYFTVIITYASGKTITLTREMSVTFKWTGSTWKVKKRSVIGKSAQVDYGTFASTPFIYENMILRAGQILNRVDYPALWHYISFYMSPVTDAAWLTGAVGNYSTGDGSTTFRMPDDRGLFFRNTGINSVLKLADAVTFFNGGTVCSIAFDSFQGHGTSMIVYSGSASAGAVGIQGVSQAGSSPVSGKGNTLESNTIHGDPRVSGETAPARVSRYSVTYFED